MNYNNKTHYNKLDIMQGLKESHAYILKWTAITHSWYSAAGKNNSYQASGSPKSTSGTSRREQRDVQ